MRVENFKQTNDAHLVATYFQFGRYLLICSSQPGGQPANLQGIWNDKLFPSWDSKYTCNINLEMNYWPSEVTNLSELNEPLFRLIREVSETGKETRSHHVWRQWLGATSQHRYMAHHGRSRQSSVRFMAQRRRMALPGIFGNVTSTPETLNSCTPSIPS